MSGNNSNDDEIQDEFGRFKIVVRKYQSAHRGVVWRDGERLLDVTGESNREVKVLIDRKLHDHFVEQAGMKGGGPLAASDVANALSILWPCFTDAQRSMILAQYRAANRCMTASELAKPAGFKNFNAANLWYGKAGFLLFTELPRLLEFDPKTKAPVYSFWISDAPTDMSVGEEEWVWQMRPEVAKGLELAVLV